MIIVSVCVAIALGVRPAPATTIYVDHSGGGDYLTIQEGIDAASYGDTVLVVSGVYVEHLVMNGDDDGVILLSVAGPDCTAIDGNDETGQFPLLRIENTGPETIVSGFLFRKNNVASSPGGGGIRLDTGAARIEGNVFEYCTASWDGGAIFVLSSDATIIGNTIRHNRASIGGGISIVDGTAEISGNSITDNVAQGWDTHWGGGICVYGSSATITENTIARNYTIGAGGGVLLKAAGATISDNLICDNLGGVGNAMDLWYPASVVVSGNVITGNAAYNGGGRCITQRGSPFRGQVIFEDNIITGNEGDVFWVAQGGLPALVSNFLAGNEGLVISVDAVAPAGTIDMRGNWWGTVHPATIEDLIYDCEDDPGIQACVDFSAWCVDSSCSGLVTSVPEESVQGFATWGRIKSMFLGE